MNKETNNDQLLPCPFCGGTPITCSLDDRYYIKCTQCGASGSKFYSGPGIDITWAYNKAAEAWDKRVIMAEVNIDFDDWKWGAPKRKRRKKEYMNIQERLYIKYNGSPPVRKGVYIDHRGAICKNGKYRRDYYSTQEVLETLNTSEDRQGHFPIYVTGANGGPTEMYWFQNGIRDTDLVLMFPVGAKSIEYWFDGGTKLDNLVPKVMPDTKPYVQMPVPDLLKQMNEDFWPINHRLLEFDVLSRRRPLADSERAEYYMLREKYFMLQKYFKIAGYTPVYNGEPGKLLS